MSVNGQEVAGSPFPVLVSIHPTELGNPVRVIPTEGLLPRDVAVSSAGEVVVTFHKSVVMYDKNGKRLRSSESSKFQINLLWSVTIDNRTNNMFVVGNSVDSHKIVQLDLDLKINKEVSIKGTINYTGITVVGDELMMCNSNEGCVMVYNKELEYVRRIGSKGNGVGQFSSNVYGISSDEHGILYVCDSTKARVLVFSKAGKFLHSFSNRHDKLKFALGLCVSGQYVYVSDKDGHSLHIFTTVGDYVAKIGKRRGQGKGDFSRPWDVCVDKDGYVYVCDNSNNRVKIF